MKRQKWLFILAHCIFFIMFSGTVAFATQTFVVLGDVVFAREAADKASRFEEMNKEQLAYIYVMNDANGLPPYFYYGENIVGEIVKTKPAAIRIRLQKEGNRNNALRATWYVDLNKLWREPAITAVAANRQMTVRDALVYLLPDKKSRKVLSLYQGEVVEAVGSLDISGISWTKVRFCNDWEDEDSYKLKYEEGKSQFQDEHCSRYGYIASSDLLPLLSETINESKLSAFEIPRTIRKSTLKLSEADKERLAQDGFYIEPIPPDSKVWVDDMADLYHSVKSSVFITSDFYLHAFHLIFDRMLQDVEARKIFPEIEALTKKLVMETDKDMRTLDAGNERIRRALTHNLFFFSVAAKLFDPKFKVPAAVRADVTAVAGRIVKAEGPLPSLINKIELGNEDFTQYRVRGHYQVKPASQEEEVFGHHSHTSESRSRLANYFRGMMWYGRRQFLLSDDEKTVSAVLITKALETSGETMRWRKIDTVLTRLIGKADDWSPLDYGSVSLKVFGTKSPSFQDLADAEKVKAFRTAAREMLPMQRIISVQTGLGHTQQERLELTAGFKFLGQRFTPDAYIFNQLTSPSVGSDQDPRNLPMSLDVMTLLGSEAAEKLLKEQNQNHEWSVAYQSQAEKLKRELSAEILKGETSYARWLHVLAALTGTAQSKQLFTIGDPWQYKQLNTALGSWTELKHDTILYSKQSYAESGSGGPFFEIPDYRPPYVKGYVEPNPLFFKGLTDLVASLRSELQGNGFLPDEYKDKLQTFESLGRRAYEIAVKEIEGKPLTRDDYGWMELMSNSFDRSFLLPRDSGDIVDPETVQMALITDVATDAVEGRVLEAAVGVPQRIIVAVKDTSGGTRICTGYVYSWYEFADTKRWTDKDWKALVYGKDQNKLKKLRPSWYSKLLK